MTEMAQVRKRAASRMLLSKKAIRTIILNKCAEDPSYAESLRQNGHWLPDRVVGLSTDELISKLRDLGVPFEKESFRRQLEQWKSAELVSDAWLKRIPALKDRLDADLLFEGAMALRDRLAPDIVTSEVLDDWMQEGYELLARKKEAPACELWLKVWRHIVERLPGGGHSTADADAQVLLGTQSVFNWIQQFETALHNAGTEDSRFHEERLRVAREFQATFDGEESLVPTFAGHEGESLYALGRPEEGDRTFRRLTERWPGHLWGWVRWGDVCWWGKSPSKDYGKAERIYREALSRGVPDERDILRERLASLKKEQPVPPSPVPRRQGTSAGKTGRNEPCPCGSGKKFKRCCVG